MAFNLPIFLCCLALLTTCNKKPGILYTAQFRSMGVLFKIKFLSHYRAEKNQDIANKVFNIIDELDYKFTGFRQDSLIKKIERQALKKKITIKDKDILNILRLSLRMYKITGGMFNVFQGKLYMNVKKVLRGEARLGELKSAKIKISDIEFNWLEKTIKLRKKIQFDFGGIAKGYACDRALTILKNENIQSALIDASGDVCAMGTSLSGEKGRLSGWKVGILDAESLIKTKKEKILANVILKNMALATSGSYIQSKKISGKMITHIIDTNKPIVKLTTTRMVSSSVLAKNAAFADALATALMLMPPEKSLSLINGMENVEALIIDNKFHYFWSKGFKKFIAK